MFLFLILIKPIKFDPEEKIGPIITSRSFKSMKTSHYKYMDDLTLAEKVDLKRDLTINHEITHPASFHQRTGHNLLPSKCATKVKVNEISEFAIQNEMKINKDKCSVRIFNRSKKYDFMPSIELENEVFKVNESFKLLGVVISSNLKWHEHVNFLSRRGNNKLWLLRTLKKLGAPKKLTN